MSAAPPGVLGVAVSGGSDSMALLCLLAQSGHAIRAVTLDHGLRPDSAAEAAIVARFCATRGIAHDTLHWTRPPRGNSGGNLQAAARDARRALLSQWAQGAGLAAMALGHTRDDQAETFVMRLARGSGVDGLSAMAPVSRHGGMVWLRPLLGQTREDLRAWLRGKGIDWIDDPSNHDTRFDRVRLRAAAPVLDSLGLTARRLAQTAAAMALVREALEAATLVMARHAAKPDALGQVCLDLPALHDAPEEIRLRLVAAALTWVSRARYRPRLASLRAALQALLTAPGQRSLHGCLLRHQRQTLILRREPAALPPPGPPVPLWDGRWQIVPPDRTQPSPKHPDGLVLRALGRDGLAQVPGWRAAGWPGAALVATPALWLGDRLVSAPVLGLGDWQCHLAGGPGAFYDSLNTR